MISRTKRKTSKSFNTSRGSIISDMEICDIIRTFEELRHTYNFDITLKDEQIKIVQSVLNKRNTFGVLPTGYGKSLCYVLPPLMLDELDWSCRHIAIVISPLKSLMADQVKELQKFGVSALAIEPKHGNMEAITEGKFSIIFISPESAVSAFWRSFFLKDELQNKICLLACDEAHCISEWGEDFRPEYKEILNLRSILDVPVLAVTATCDDKVKEDIFKTLSLDENTQSFYILPNRPNIYLDVRQSSEDYEEEMRWLLDYICHAQSSATKTVVYCRTVSGTAALYNHFKDSLLTAKVDTSLVDMFHKSIDADSAKRILDTFKEKDSKIRCLFATIAFGLGVQIPDIQLVVHWGVSKSLLSYWQEIGRAGRNGSDSYAICFAFPRSMIRRLTDDKVIKIAKSAKQQEDCIRVQVLQGLSLGSKVVIEKKKCTLECDNACNCDFCRCCSVCHYSCDCINKYASFFQRTQINFPQ